MILESVNYVPSPNFSRRSGFEVAGVVLHYTAGGSAHGSLRWMTNPASRVSSHFLVGRDGATWQLVPLDKAAWHAGPSEWTYQGETRHGCNRYTIGIELANHGLVFKAADGRYWYEIGRELYLYRQDSHPQRAQVLFDNGNKVSGFWEPYPSVQLLALHKLIRDLRTELGKSDLPLVGHEEIAMPMGRKTDPGPLFPWEDYGRPNGRRTKSALIIPS